MFFDLRATGPFVIEPPPQSLCVVDDFWFRYVADMGIAGPDRGEGGKYLFLPPGHEGEVPDGYFVYRSPTFTNWAVFRALGGVPAMKETQDLSRSPTRRPAADGVRRTSPTCRFNTSTPTTSRSSRRSTRSSRRSRSTALDPERAGQLAAIGIVHGRPFAPDERRRATLDDAARAGAAISRALRLLAPRPRGRDLRGLVVAAGVHRWQLRVPARRRPAARRPRRVPLPRHGHHARPWPTPRSAPARPTPTPPRTPTATPSTAARAYTPDVCRRTRRPRTSGRSTSTTPRPARCSSDRRPLPERHEPRRHRRRRRRRLLHDLVRPDGADRPARPTGSRPCPARAGSRSCACTAHSSPGSTRPGGRARSCRPDAPARAPDVRR